MRLLYNLIHVYYTRARTVSERGEIVGEGRAFRA